VDLSARLARGTSALSKRCFAGDFDSGLISAFRLKQPAVLSSPLLSKPDMRPLAMYDNAHNWYAAPEQFVFDISRNDLPPFVVRPYSKHDHTRVISGFGFEFV
jgi:hypothetical protein